MQIKKGDYMVKIYIGERVQNKRGEIGVITAFDGGCITVDYPSRRASVVPDGFEKGYLRYEKPALQGEVQDSIAEIELAKKQKLEEARTA
ncbi:MAG: hypothetical protein IIW33_04345, partial [Oscillospiraceae bacterium]|nr:hypothetical protein [Oscillospiraceae bacterium]